MENKKILLAKPYVNDEAIKKVVEVLRSGWLSHGSKVKEFEDSFAQYIGVKHAISFNSCTSALQLAIQALGIKGEIIVPSFTFVASANSIVTSGAKPVFIDIEYGTCNMDASLLEAMIGKDTEAIMPVHFGGQSCDMAQISRIAAKHKLALIEDSAETIGGTFKSKKTGSFGVGCFSFFPTKNITTAEGGMITTNDSRLAGKVSALRAHGIIKDKAKPSWAREAHFPGYNYRLNNVLAAIGVEQMKILDSLNEKRRSLACIYNGRLKDLRTVVLPVEAKDRAHVYQMYTIKLGIKSISRDSIVKKLNERSIEASVHFDPPVHEQMFYNSKKFRRGALPVTERVSKSIISLPMHPGLEPKDIDTVCDNLIEILKKGR